MGHHVQSEKKISALVIGCCMIRPKVIIVFNNCECPSPPHSASRRHDRDIHTDTLKQLVNYYVTSFNVKTVGHRQLNTESKSTNNVRRPCLLVWNRGC